VDGGTMEREDSFLHVLSDEVTLGILTRIVNTKGCTLKDLLDADAVKEEFNVLIETMEEYGLIERIGDTVQLTEKGKEFSKLCEGLKEIMEKSKKEREVST
jgi:predicted transcriptional regulator